MKPKKLSSYVSLLILLLALAACGKSTATPKPTATLRPTALPTAVAAAPSRVATMAVILPPTSSPRVVVPLATVAPTAPAVQPGSSPLATPTPVALYGQTDTGAYRLGSADAPIVIFDYSDFL